MAQMRQNRFVYKVYGSVLTNRIFEENPSAAMDGWIFSKRVI
jgi:hypothetical protein